MTIIGGTSSPPRSGSPPRLSVALVGFGRLGGVLASALARAGHHVSAVATRSPASAARAEALLDGVRLGSPAEVVPGADLVLLCVPDDVLPKLVAELAAAGVWHSGMLVAHTSGAYGIGVLEPAAACGAHPLALHPVMTFPGRSSDPALLVGVPFGITTAAGMRPVGEALVLELGAEPFWVPEQARALYHAALAHGANHLVTLVNDALELLEGSGVEEAGLLAGPLLRTALDNTLRLRDRALTGPLSRGDADVVLRHATALAQAAPEVLPAYLALARRTADRAHASGVLGARSFTRLLEVLSTATTATPAEIRTPPRIPACRESTTLAATAGPRSGVSGRPNTVVVSSRIDLSAARAQLAGPVGVVMTMGALHAGHAELVRRARAESASVVVTIFVNPLQFGQGEDLDRYPRTLAADLRLCEDLGADLVFTPEPDELYQPGQPLVTVDPGPLGAEFEGASRAGHFRGVLTVVSKLLNLVRPESAFFGEKDFQQLTLVRQMVAALDLPVTVVGVPTVRDDDDLALSSRNRYLSPRGRTAAGVIPRALRAARAAAADGQSADNVLAAARELLAGEPNVTLDYLELTTPDLIPLTDSRHSVRLAPGTADLGSDRSGDGGAAELIAQVAAERAGPPPDPPSGDRPAQVSAVQPPSGQLRPARILVAATVDGTRLIDNMHLELAPLPSALRVPSGEA